MKNIFIVLTLTLLVLTLSTSTGNTQPHTILYVPFDNRPVCYDYVISTIESTEYKIITPPEYLLYIKNHTGNPDLLWQWLTKHILHVDAMVISADSMLYGGLVPSRMHHTPAEVIRNRLTNFDKIKQLNPSLRLYVFSSVMRTPKNSIGGMEPLYYEKYGPSFFALTALQDKAELTSLSLTEQLELQKLLTQIPADSLQDWFIRRNLNFQTNVALIDKIKQNQFDYLAIGLDDNALYSQTHREMRHLSKYAAGLPSTKFQILPGVDQLGIVLLARAINDLSWKIPSIAVTYAPGSGANTIPTYSDREVGKSVMAHIIAAGGVPLLTPEIADFVLVVNTPPNGITLEANDSSNHSLTATNVVANQIKSFINQEMKVIVADIAFANGADNNLMHHLVVLKALPGLCSYAGWNTADNSIGYAVSQGFLSSHMLPNRKNKLLLLRLLDDWAYQANARNKIAEHIVYPAKGNPSALDALQPALELAAMQQLVLFSKTHLQEFTIKDLEVTFPWNRLFEIRLEVR